MEQRAEVIHVHADLDEAEREVAVLPPTSTSRRLQQMLSLVRRTVGPRDSEQATPARQLAFLRGIVADVRSEARRQGVIVGTPVADAAAQHGTKPAPTRIGDPLDDSGALERRRDARTPVRAPVTFTPWDPTCAHPGVTTNLSTRGAFVATARPLPEGSPIALRIWPVGWDVEAVLAGVVRRSSTEGMAVRFVDSGEVGSRAIRAVMSSRRGMPLRPVVLRRE